jgi:hypothetical protein
VLEELEAVPAPLPEDVMPEVLVELLDELVVEAPPVPVGARVPLEHAPSRRPHEMPRSEGKRMKKK